MSQSPSLESPDDDLRRLAERMSLAGFDSRRTLRRLWWAERTPALQLCAVIAAIAVSLFLREWWAAVIVAARFLPQRIDAWRERKAERASLLTQDDFFEVERTRLERRLSHARFRAVLGLALASLIAALAAVGTKHATVHAVLAAAIGVHALFSIAVTCRALERELRDLGGEVPGGWFIALFVLALPLILPFYLIGKLIRRSVLRLRGRKVEDET